MMRWKIAAWAEILAVLSLAGSCWLMTANDHGFDRAEILRQSAAWYKAAHKDRVTAWAEKRD